MLFALLLFPNVFIFGVVSITELLFNLLYLFVKTAAGPYNLTESIVEDKNDESY